ncbi:MAG: GNAT family N-acetyltransferase [Oceanospirillaceae bacterium]|nr:GNAT family N-acetyltransferase [Oceanospirillaceae bacterium]
MNFVEIEHNSPEWTEAVRLRERILREPLGSKFSAEELDEERNHIQIAGFINNELVATAVLVPEGEAMKMQRVVVAETLRNKNIGSNMMEFCESLAAEKGVKVIYCHARDSAVNFYARNNYEKVGEYFDEDGIPHLMMRKQL